MDIPFDRDKSTRPALLIETHNSPSEDSQWVMAFLALPAGAINLNIDSTKNHRRQNDGTDRDNQNYDCPLQTNNASFVSMATFLPGLFEPQSHTITFTDGGIFLLDPITQ